MTTSTELVASVEIAHESRTERIPGGAADGAVLRVIPGDVVRVAALLGRDPKLAPALSFGALAGGASLVGLVGTHDGRTFVERARALARRAVPISSWCSRPIAATQADWSSWPRLCATAASTSIRCRTSSSPPTSAFASASPRRSPRAPSSRFPTCVRPPDAMRWWRACARCAGARRATSCCATRRSRPRARSMAASAKADVVLLDVTGGATSIIHARPDGAVLGIHERLGVGAAADRVVARAGLDRVRRWIPRAVEAPALLERVFNRARWPDAIPASVLALSLEMALAREAIAHTLADAERAGIVARRTVVRSAGRSHRPARGASAGRAVAAGRDRCVRTERPDARVARAGRRARRRGCARRTRSCRDDAGHGADRDLRLDVAASLRDGARAATRTASVEERVARGSFVLVPTKGAVEIVMPGTKVRPSAEHLGLGVVIDARGRPLALPPRDAERIPTLARWHSRARRVADGRALMPWQYSRWSADHPLPIGASERAAEGQEVRAGDILAAGTTYGTPVKISGARRLGVAPEDLERVHARRGRRRGRAEDRHRAHRTPFRARGLVADRGPRHPSARRRRPLRRADRRPLGRAIHARRRGVALGRRVRDGRWDPRGRCRASPRTDPTPIGELSLAVDAPNDELHPSRIDVRHARPHPHRRRARDGGSRSRAHTPAASRRSSPARRPPPASRVVYGDAATASGATTGPDAPTVLCLIGFGSAPLPRAGLRPARRAGRRSRRGAHGFRAALRVRARERRRLRRRARRRSRSPTTGSARGRWTSTSRSSERRASRARSRRTRSTTDDGPVPVANVLAFDAPRTPASITAAALVFRGGEKAPARTARARTTQRCRARAQGAEAPKRADKTDERRRAKYADRSQAARAAAHDHRDCSR